MCPLWILEKRWYSGASGRGQARARAVYTFLYRIGLLVTGRSYRRFLLEYHAKRGMDFHHDVHDWLGGWPYESISPAQVDGLMSRIGFAQVRSFVRRGKILGRDPGFFGSGCDEYVYRRDAAAPGMC